MTSSSRYNNWSLTTLLSLLQTQMSPIVPLTVMACTHTCMHTHMHAHTYAHTHAHLRAFDVVVEVISKGVDEVDGLITSCIVLEVPREQHCAERSKQVTHKVSCPISYRLIATY